ncbi:MAG: DUF3108 domain-containing protein [Thermoanaerobaculia bacterium]
MKKSLTFVCAVALVMAAGGTTVASASDSFEPINGAKEQLQYNWHLRGFLGWIAGLRFPSSGVGELRTVAGSESVQSRLMITTPSGQDGFYLYQSQMDQSGEKTLISYHGYEWGGKRRKIRTFFDYVKNIARIHKETSTETEDKIKPTDGREMRDVLTGIFYLRQNAASIDAPITTTIFSDGTSYPVLFRPMGMETLTFQSQKIPTRVFLITAVPGSRHRYPGGVKVWITDDAKRLPLRIEIEQTMAALRLDLRSIDASELQIAKR